MKNENCKLKMASGSGAMNPDELADDFWTLRFACAMLLIACRRPALGRHVASQLVRSGTAAGPNYEEGCAAESRRDFCHKLGIVLERVTRIARLAAADLFAEDCFPRRSK